MENKSEILRIDGLYFDYSDTSVLKDVNLTLYKGDFLGIIGSNGAGKSTLIKLILGKLPYYKGSIYLFGTDIKKKLPRDKIGYVSQKANAFNTSFPATVREVVTANLYSKSGFMKRSCRDSEQRLKKALESVGMEGAEDKLIGRLSGGQQQRVFIARALISEPELLLMDEPTVGVDSQSVNAIMELISELNRQGITIVMTNHDTPTLVEAASKLLIFCSHGNGEFVDRKGLTIEQINQIYAGKRKHNHK
ncbi:MAG: metal ABC transporter ATP-binding protein [Clostridia bacterium]|nr:metal ABC transporter ATP-binding protein [Clostridia bacterium]